jgi:hypothetical protein
MMTKNVTAFGASQPGRMKSALFTHKGDGRLAKRGKLKQDLARPEPYLGNVGSYIFGHGLGLELGLASWRER